jgi:NADH dehydrogenase
VNATLNDRHPHRVVIVGAGFGGLFATRFLKRAPVKVTLVDRVNHHLFQPLLYQVATGILSSGQIAPAIRDVLRHQRNVEVKLANVADFDLEARAVSAKRIDGRPLTIPYDSLIVAAGAGQSYFGHEEFARWAPGLKTINDALEIRGRVLGAFEMAELEEDADARGEWLTFVVVGGGATGVEIAGQIAELSRRTLRNNFTRIDPASARVLLFDGGERILASFGDRLSAHGARELERLGVEIHTRSFVTDLDGHRVAVKGPDGSVRQVPARTKIWAAGIQASPLAERLARDSGADLDGSGRIAVLADCSLPGHPEVFAVGDMMALDELPGVAEVAMQSGIHAANTIKRKLNGEDAEPFTYRDLGSMATIARFRAIVSFKGIRLTGFAGWLIWLVVHLTFLTGFKNRFITVANWAVSLISRGRTERTITGRQVVARAAIEEAGGEPFLFGLDPVLEAERPDRDGG